MWLPNLQSAFGSFYDSTLDRISDAARCASGKWFARHKRAAEAPREDRTLEGIDGHELCGLAHLLRHAGVPVLDLDKNSFAIVVTAVAYVNGPARVPVRWTWAPSNVSRGKLAGNLFNEVLYGVVGEVACVAGIR